MNRDETWDLFKQGKDAWNAWAEEMLVKRKALEEAGEWQVDWHGDGETAATKDWQDSVNADFIGRDFTAEVLEDSLHFGGLVFPGHAWFRHARFQGAVDLKGAKFYGNARFEGATFGGTAGFEGATFNGNAVFGNAVFRGSAEFRGATFCRTAWFVEAAFQNNAEFANATFCAIAWFEGATFDSHASFYKVVLKGPAYFGAIEVKRAFSLAGASFQHVPDFVQANFAQAPRLDDLEVRVSEGSNQVDSDYEIPFEAKSDVEAKWRALKRLAIQAHDHARELDFFAKELNARRGHAGLKQPGVLVASLLYQGLSNFGRSIALPMVWLLVTVALFYGLYLGNHSAWMDRDYSVAKWTYLKVTSYADRRELPPDPCVVGSKDSNTFSAAIALSWRNTIPFAGLGAPEKLNQVYRCLYGVNVDTAGLQEHVIARLPPRIPDRIAFYGVLQTIISAVLLFLFLLALRNHFRIK